jgi:hypothetical protein
MDDLLIQLKASQSDLTGFFSILSARILQMLRSNPDQVFNLLYRVDVSEAKAKQAFDLVEDQLIADRLAELIIEREQQKLKYRAKNID